MKMKYKNDFKFNRVRTSWDIKLKPPPSFRSVVSILAERRRNFDLGRELFLGTESCLLPVPFRDVDAGPTETISPILAFLAH